MWKAAIFLTILATLTGCSTPQPRQIPLPVCGQPIPITAEIWNDLQQMREVMSGNALIYQECITRYRERIEAFNETG